MVEAQDQRYAGVREAAERAHEIQGLLFGVLILGRLDEPQIQAGGIGQDAVVEPVAHIAPVPAERQMAERSGQIAPEHRLFVHVLDTALVRVGPQAYNEVIETYKTPIVGLMEIGLVAAVLYHALNGVRVILIDFWQHGPKYQRLMLWIVAGVFLAVMIPALGVLGMHMAERFL